MGIIKAAFNSLSGMLGEQYLEAIEADRMDKRTIATGGVRIGYDDKRNTNVNGTADVISNGSVIHVYPNQFMLLTDGGRVVDYTAEPGYFLVDQSSQPSLFNGQFGASLKDTWERLKFGGATPQRQKVFFINLQEISGIKFGTPNPISYFDSRLNAHLYLRAFGNYSIKVTDPLLFFSEVLPRDRARTEIDEVNAQYLSEFLGAFQTALTKLSMDGIEIAQAGAHNMELAKHMADILDEDWGQARGFIVHRVGIENISFDEETRRLLSLRSEGAMLSDPSIRQGYVQGAIARGIENAGKNEAGAGQAFMGVGLGLNAGGNFMGQASADNMEQMRQAGQFNQNPGNTPYAQNNPQAGGPKAVYAAAPGAGNGGAAAGNGWTCPKCGHQNAGGKFCAECGTKKPEGKKCANCGFDTGGKDYKFCPECGNPLG